MKDINICTPKFHILDYVVKNVWSFGDLKCWNAFSYEHFNFITKKLITMTSASKGIKIKEDVCFMNVSAKVTENLRNRVNERQRSLLSTRVARVIMEMALTATDS